MLGGRLSRLVGLRHTRYLLPELLPPEFAESEVHRVELSLLTGERPVEAQELLRLPDPTTRDALLLTRLVLVDLDVALRQVATTPAHVLRRMEPETAAVLALELFRQGDTPQSNRVFAARSELLLARRELKEDVLGGIALRALASFPVGMTPIPARAPGEPIPEQLHRPWIPE
ncbi:MAG: hypothetical protein JXB05_04065 [Myxococcaceae bacterium]|nr:hypothetical protein [Myxococcaceae bacterium]